MNRTLWLALIFFSAALSLVEAKVPVADSELGFSFELPQGFQEAPRSFPGQKPEDIRACYSHPLVAGQPDIVCAVVRLHGPLPQAPASPSASAGQSLTTTEESWKSVNLSVLRVADAAQVTFSVGVPLVPEAVQIVVSGPVAREQRVHAALKTILSTLEGKTAAAQKTPAPAAAAPPAQPKTAQAKEPVRPRHAGGGTEKPGSRSQAMEHSLGPAGWAAMIGGLIVACIAGYALLLRFKRLTPHARYYALMAFGGGIALFSLSEVLSFGRGHDPRILQEGLVLGGAFIAFGAWCLWCLRRQGARLPVSAPAPQPPQGTDLTKMTDFQIRRLGLCFLFLGAAGSYLLVVQPLQEAAEHKPHISYHESVLLFIPLLLGCGLLLASLGKRAVPAVNLRGGQKSWLGVVVLGLFIVLGVALLIWFKMKLRELGYDRP